jgi:hypothetical protein
MTIVALPRWVVLCAAASAKDGLLLMAFLIGLAGRLSVEDGPHLAYADGALLGVSFLG